MEAITCGTSRQSSNWEHTLKKRTKMTKWGKTSLQPIKHFHLNAITLISKYNKNESFIFIFFILIKLIAKLKHSNRYKLINHVFRERIEADFNRPFMACLSTLLSIHLLPIKLSLRPLWSHHFGIYCLSLFGSFEISHEAHSFHFPRLLIRLHLC